MNHQTLTEKIKLGSAYGEFIGNNGFDLVFHPSMIRTPKEWTNQEYLEWMAMRLEMFLYKTYDYYYFNTKGYKEKPFYAFHIKVADTTKNYLLHEWFWKRNIYVPIKHDLPTTYEIIFEEDFKGELK